MRTILIATAMAFGIASMSAAYAEPTLDAAGPVKQGSLCKYTDAEEMYGYLAPCAPKVVASKKMKNKKS